MVSRTSRRLWRQSIWQVRGLKFGRGAIVVEEEDHVVVASVELRVSREFTGVASIRGPTYAGKLWIPRQRFQLACEVEMCRACWTSTSIWTPSVCLWEMEGHMDWDDAYDNSGHIPGAQEYVRMWAGRAAAFRNRWQATSLDLPYGERERERFDLFRPDGPERGLVVFVHGGYWMRFDKSYWSDLANGALTSGWAVAMPSYCLAPDVRIAAITRQIGQAIAVAASRVGGPVHLAGHSAGGHLVTRMICKDSPLPPEVFRRIRRVVSISGLHDLHPLMKTKLNDTLRLDLAEAASESPALLEPAEGIPVTAWVGDGERPEFIRQARLLADAWPDAEVHVDAGKHHFDVVEGLHDRNAPLCDALLA